MRGVETIRWILYADDVVLFCANVGEAEAILNIIKHTCKRFGLSVSFSKTKTQVFNNKQLVEKPSLFSIGEENVENVRDFVYLGLMISNREKRCYTKLRFSQAVAKFNELRKVLREICSEMTSSTKQNCFAYRKGL